MHTSPTPIVALAGARGFLGRHLTAAVEADGYTVREIGRESAATWADPASLRAAVDGAQVLVNLAGRTVDCRYTDRHRAEILDSRVRTTALLREAVVAASAPPRVWLNASTATIYRHAMDRPQTETDGDIGTGFSADVASAWEEALFAAETPGTRRIALRLAIVLGDGPATGRLLTLTRLGLGGAHLDGWSLPHRRYRGIGPHATGGDRAPWYRTRGRQRFSWVHIDDVVGAVRFLRDRDDLEGAINVSSPHPSDDRTLMRTLRREVGMPVGLPSTRLMLDAAMWVLRSEPELLLKSRWVIPQRLLDAGFVFRHPDLTDAVRAVRTTAAR